MTTNSPWYGDVEDAVRTALDRAARHWRDEYDQMNITTVSATRRDRAIAAVTEALEAYEYDDELTIDAISALIVDNSDLAFFGFDAHLTMPTTWFGRSAFARWLQPWW